MPQLYFTSPRVLPRADKLHGRVVVLDVAFAATIGSTVSFDRVTRPFLAGLGSRLAAWIDHHDHEYHARFAGDPRFVLATKAQHGACPEMVTPEIVERTGPVGTMIDQALRARFRDEALKHRVVHWLVGGLENKEHRAVISEAASEFQAM